MEEVFSTNSNSRIRESITFNVPVLSASCASENLDSDKSLRSEYRFHNPSAPHVVAIVYVTFKIPWHAESGRSFAFESAWI